MLAILLLLTCAVAVAVVAGILFVLHGPILTRRLPDVRRLALPMPMSAAPVMFGTPVVGTPSLPVATSPLFSPVPATGLDASADPFAPVPLTLAPAHAHPGIASAVPHAIAPAGSGPVARPAATGRSTAPRTGTPGPLAAPLRRPRTQPSPLPRTRAARGTQAEPPRPRTHVEARAARPSRPNLRGVSRSSVPHDFDPTEEVPLLDADELTHVDDAS